MSILKTLKELNRKEQFHPGILGLFINANYFIKRGVYEGVASNSASCKGRLLDVGCGNKPYRSLFNVDEYTGIDIENEAHDHSNEPVDLFYDGIHIPFENERFDSVISIEVFEHVFELEKLIPEVNRVLVPGGNLLVTLPFVWIEHEKPNDFARYTSFGIKALLERNGFEVIRLQKSGTFIETITQLKAAYIYNSLLPQNRILKALGTLLIVAPVNLLGSLISMMLPENKDLYLNNIVLAKKIQEAGSGSTS